MQLKAHDCTQFKDFSSLQFKGSNMIQHGSTKQAQWRHGVLRLVWKSLSVLHWDMTSIPLNTFGMNRYTNFPVMHPSSPTPTYLPNSPDALGLSGQIPTAMLQNLLKSLSKRLESVIASFSLQIITKPIPCLFIRLTDNHYWPDTFYSCRFLQKS